MSFIATSIGALIPTFFLSRLLLWLMRTWNGGTKRLAGAHAGALLVASFVGGMGMADGGAFAGTQAMAMYALPQGLWFLLDLYRQRSGKPEVTGSSTSA